MRGRRLVLLLVTLATVLVGGSSLIRTIRGFYQLDFPVTWVAEGVRVDDIRPGSTGDEADLRPGDLVATVDGVPVHRLDNPLFSLAAGSEHLLTVFRPGVGFVELTLRPPPPNLNQAYLARTAVGAVGLICAVLAAFTTRRREGPTFLLLASASFLVGVLPHRTAATALGLAVLHRLSGAAIPFLMVRFFAIFPERKNRLLWWDVATILATVSSGLTPIWPDIEAWWPAMLLALRMLFSGALLLGITLQIRRWWLAAGVARIRRQIEWAGLGLFVGLVPLLCLVTVPQSLGIHFDPFSWLAILPLAAVPLGFLAALHEYRLWDLEPITRDLVSATLVFASGGFAFVLTNYLLQTYAVDLGNLRNLIAFAAGILLVVLLQPVRKRVERFLDEWLHYGRPTPRWLLTHATREMAAASESRDLLFRLAENLHEGLDIDPVATFLRADETEFLRVYPAEAENLPTSLPATTARHPFPHDGESALAAEGFAQRVGLERGETIHGLVYLGLRRGSAPLGTEAEGVVSAFAAQAALGLENARRLDELRRQAEEYRILHANTERIIESSAAGILVCAADGRILSVNNLAASLFGIPSRDLVGNHLENYVVLPETWSPYLPIHAERAETRTKGDPVIHIVMTASILELDSGSFNGRVIVLQDVTELRVLQDRVREQDRMAALGRLAAGLAHEINTPLTGISSYAQMLGDIVPADDPGADLVKKLVNQSFRVSQIVANLRGVVRGDSGEAAEIDIAPIVRQVGHDTAVSLSAESRFRTDIPEAPVLAWASSGALEIAVGNLVRNAIEATPSPELVVLSLERKDGRALIRVDDMGPGIPADQRSRVFDAFFTTKSERGGSGLGLAITRDVITQLGGRVWLEGLPGQGTRALVELQTCKPQPASS